MKGRKVTGGILMVLGIAFFVFGVVITGKVTEGRQKIQKAQRGVNTIQEVSKINEHTQRAGRYATQPMQQKIDDGKVEADTYERVSFWLKVGGGVFFLFGLILFLMGFKKKKE